jgi:hypothetical protein
MPALIFSSPSVWNISHSKKNWKSYDQKCILVFRVKKPLFLTDFKEMWIFSTDFGKNAQTSDLMKIYPVGAELFHVKRRSHDKANSLVS